MIAAALAMAAIAFAPGTDESFESMSALPPEWQLVEYVPGVSSATIETGDAAKGDHFLRLSAPKENHTRVFIPVQVEPNSTYRFSARVRADGAGAVPAVLSLDGSNITSDAVAGDGEWHASRLYLTTGTASEVTLVLSLGKFGQTVAGDADFDVLKLAKIDATPPGALIAAPAGAAGVAAASGGSSDAAPPSPGVTDGPNSIVYPLAALMLALLAFSGRVLLRGDRDG